MAIERIAYEYAEDMANDGVAYFETRMCPQLLLSQHSFDHIKHVSARSLEQYASEASQADLEKMEKSVNNTLGKIDTLKAPSRGIFSPTPKAALKAVLSGLQRGEEEFGVKGRVILACIRGMNRKYIKHTL
jgi:adenosine deaminase